MVDNRAAGLTRFEHLQFCLQAAQTVILFFTLVAAIWIGTRQNEINRQLLDLHFRLSLDIVYDKGNLNIFNRGQENVWIRGNQFGDEPVRTEKIGRLINPGGFYYIMTERLQALMKKQLGDNGEGYFPWNIFVTMDNGKKYTAKLLLFVKMVGGEMSVHTQTVGFVEGDWGK